MLLVFRSSRWMKGLFSKSISHGSAFFEYSTAVSSSKPPHFSFLVDFLIHSVGFTKESALIIASKGLVWIVEGLGVPENSPMFFYAVYTITARKRSTVEKKMKILRSYEWTEEEIATFGRTNPNSWSYSKDKIRQGLNFFMKELGYAPGYIATHNHLLGSSLEKKVKPRYKVLQMLKEKKLVSDTCHIASLLAYSKGNFLKFLKRFENELPGLVETYTNSIEKT